MNEIALRETNTLAEQIDYAQAVAGGSLLPKEYQGNKANVLIAVGLGQAMGLTPAESLYRITVIQGKPTASAELIAANVRKAGHKLRVRGDEQTCTATIIRADDPDFEFAVTRDLAWAQSMGLTGKDNYKKQPGTMLQWRAITAVARLACPEALYGVTYSSDEVGDERSSAAPVVETQRVTAAELMADDVPEGVDAHTGEIIDAAPEPTAPDPITDQQTKKIGALCRELGLTDRADALDYVAQIIGREVKSRNELTKAEASDVIEKLQADVAATDVTEADLAQQEIGGEQ